MSNNEIPLLELKNVSRTFKTEAEELDILQGVDFSINHGQTAAIVGPSGSGKSTLLYLMGLLDKPDNGHVLYEGKDLGAAGDAERSKLRNVAFGFVYQYHHLLPEFTAFENVLMPAIIGGKGNKENRTHAAELLEKVGLQERMAHFPAELSGGEQQRVAVARALLNRPKLLFADEPTGNLDTASAALVFDLFEELIRQEDAAVILVTHNRKLADKCDKLYTIEHGRCTPHE